MDGKNSSIVLIVGMVVMSIATIVVNIIDTPKFDLPAVSYVAEEAKTSHNSSSTLPSANVYAGEEVEDFQQSAKETLEDYDYNIEDYHNEKTAKPINVEPEFPIDINAATQKELEAIPSIGPKTAQSILAYRDLCGGQVATIEELNCIKGIGDKTIEVLKEYLYV